MINNKVVVRRVTSSHLLLKTRRQSGKVVILMDYKLRKGGALVMKKFMLFAGFMCFLSNSLYAQEKPTDLSKPQMASQNIPTPTTPDVPTPAVPDGSKIPIPRSEVNPTPNQPPASPTNTLPPDDKPIPASTLRPAAEDATSAQKPVTTDIQPPPANPAAAAPLPQLVNCNYHIPAETTHVDQALVTQWSEKAAIQSFSFDHHLIDDQLTKLKACYTDQGWQGFNTALQTSGNLNAIKSQQLIVSSSLSGEIKINEVKENQWKVAVPLQVIYQNHQEKVPQQLTVNLLVGRKISGDLGIMQMIATTLQTSQSGNSNPDTPAKQ